MPHPVYHPYEVTLTAILNNDNLYFFTVPRLSVVWRRHTWQTVSVQYLCLSIGGTRSSRGTWRTDGLGRWVAKITDNLERSTKMHIDWLRAGRSGIEFRCGRDFPPVQTGPGAHPAPCTMGTGSFPGVKCGRGVLLKTHSLLVPRSWKSRAIPLPTFWATPGL